MFFFNKQDQFLPNVDRSIFAEKILLTKMIYLLRYATA